ncbi:MAG: hypothetical protein WA785_05690, partial [Candidatus Acidiferrales bacterium]
ADYGPPRHPLILVYLKADVQAQVVSGKNNAVGEAEVPTRQNGRAATHDLKYLFLLEVSEKPGNRLARRSDHLGDLLVSQCQAIK